LLLLLGVAAHQVVHHVCLNVVVDLVEDAVVPVQRGQAATQVAPLLTPVLTTLAAVEQSIGSTYLCSAVEHRQAATQIAPLLTPATNITANHQHQQHFSSACAEISCVQHSESATTCRGVFMDTTMFVTDTTGQ
jgi:hypothetical protein